MLSYETIEDRKALVLVDETIEELGVDPSDFTRYKTSQVLAKCVVCQQPRVVKYTTLLNRKSVGCGAPTCSKAIRSASQKKAEKKRRTPEKEKKRIEAQKQVFQDPQRVAEINTKRQATMIERYGAAHPGQVPKIREKMSTAAKSNYENDPSIVDKRRQTNLEKYGATNYLASAEGQAHIKTYSQERFGTDFPFENAEFQAHVRGVTQEKYGVANIRQLPEFRDKLKEWCIDNPEKTFCSAAEQEILDWVQTFYPDAHKYRTFDHEIDIYIPQLKLGIEYNGLYYHDEVRKGKGYHLAKTLYFKSEGIRIVHIWENEWRDRKKQVQSFLKSALIRNTNRIGARQCKIIWSSQKEDIKEAHQLLEDNHIQGASARTKYVIKALYKGKLIAVSTFARHHRTNKAWVLTRFCIKEDWSIQGMLSRMSKKASQMLQEDIISWADHRLSQGNGYEKAGWIFDELLKPDYFYHNHKGRVIAKQSRQKKKVGTPEGMTEKEHAEQDGLRRVWDCGKIRYIYRFKSIEGSRAQ